MINPNFLNSVAQYADSKVKAVVLNGTYSITQFKVKAVSGGILTLEYLVPFGAVDAITSIELWDGQGNKISTNAVYVPIASDTIMRQTITIKEG
ncbi:ketopantoate hydroxymethyltransferase [Paenibacillus sp. GbtcB18]|uniref:ketopantoate hydroxymethyltransferase n=1 Tax=Paenibacillus sp. GbtcB18 TaxID=2824763 RepID=UPI001C2FFDA8|nr:ketopantoate hydroxymethyltransferase [Paenibacillus sp. GbtcB18]